MTTFTEYIEKLIRDLKTPSPIGKEGRISEIEQWVKITGYDETGEWIIDTIDALNEAGKDIVNFNSLYYLSFTMAKAVLFISKKGSLNSAVPYTNFLKKDLFKFLLLNRDLGNTIIKAIYRATGLKNDPLKDNGFGDLFGREGKYSEPAIYIDNLYITYTFADFFIRCERDKGLDFFTGEERDMLNRITKNYTAFKEYADTDLTIHPERLNPFHHYEEGERREFVYEKEAKDLLKEIGSDWSALSYSICEVYRDYDRRVLFAKGVVSENPKIAYARLEEEPLIGKNSEKRAFRKAMLKLAIIIAILIPIGITAYSFLSVHPGWRSLAIIVGFFLLFATAAGPLGILAIFFLSRK